MSMYEVLAGSCDPEPHCPKVARRRAGGRVAIVGDPITDPTALAELGAAPHEVALEITEQLYRDGHRGLDGSVA